MNQQPKLKFPFKTALYVAWPRSWGHSAIAATLCVNPAGNGGCYPNIGAAVTAASANDTIKVGAGIYAESVIITKPLSLIGAGVGATIINA